MSDFDTVTYGVLTSPDQVWEQLDSFWRTAAATSSASLVQYQTYASLLYYLANNQAVAKSAARMANPTTYNPYVESPWFAIVVYQDQFINNSYRLYGEGYDYSLTPEIYYGEAGTTDWIAKPGWPIVDIGSLCDSVTATTKVIDRSRMRYDRVRGELHVAVDLFAEFPVKVDAQSGKNYVVVWCRNVQFDQSLLFDCVGWQSQLIMPASEVYAKSLALLRDMVVNGLTVGRLERLVNTAAGLPVAEKAEYVRYITNDGWRRHVITDTSVYSFPTTLTATVSVGTLLRPGQGLSSGVIVAEGAAVQALTFQQLPGVVASVALSTGVVAQLTFQNQALQWTYDAGRPSPWRFPIGGDLSAVEQYWIDVWARQNATGVFLDTVYGLTPPGPVPVVPSQVFLSDIVSNVVTALIVNVVDIPQSAATVLDRVARLLPPSACLIIQQRIDDMNDTIDAGTYVDTVTCGVQEHPTDTVSVSGTDLLLVDHTPLVVIS